MISLPARDHAGPDNLESCGFVARSLPLYGYEHSPRKKYLDIELPLQFATVVVFGFDGRDWTGRELICMPWLLSVKNKFSLEDFSSAPRGVLRGRFTTCLFVSIFVPPRGYNTETAGC